MKTILLILTFSLGTFNAVAEEAVILLHGLSRTNHSMEKLGNAFKANGYAVVNIDYPSRQKPLEEIVEIIRPAISDLANTKDKIHFVTHSMGGLVVRAYLNKYKPSNLGRVVMLSPPNQGSEIADFLKDNPLFKAVLGPAGQQLTTNQEILEEILGKPYYPLGIIAGTWSIAPLSSLIIPGDDDGKVAVKRMKLDGMMDFIELPTTHTFMMRNKHVINQAISFIQTGKFKDLPTSRLQPPPMTLP